MPVCVVVVTLEICHCPYGSHDQNMSVFGLATSQQCLFDRQFFQCVHISSSVLPGYFTNLPQYRHFKHSHQSLANTNLVSHKLHTDPELLPREG